MNKKNNTTQNVVTLISSGTELDGSVKSSSDIRVDGIVKGSINSKGKIVIGESGKVEGDIHCEIMDMIGKIKGDIFAQKSVVLKSTAKVIGNITTNQLIIEAGAKFFGGCEMGEENIRPPQPKLKK